MEVRNYFKSIVAELKRPHDERTSILKLASDRKEWFETKGKRVGRYAHITNEYIDNMPFDELNDQMLLLIQSCFQQR